MDIIPMLEGYNLPDGFSIFRSSVDVNYFQNVTGHVEDQHKYKVWCDVRRTLGVLCDNYISSGCNPVKNRKFCGSFIAIIFICLVYFYVLSCTQCSLGFE